MTISGVREANQAAFDWPQSRPDGVDPTQAQDLAHVNSLKPTDAKKEAKNQAVAFEETLKILPDFVKKDDSVARSADLVTRDLRQYESHIADRKFTKSLLDDLASQRDRISSENLNKLANTPDMTSIRAAADRVSKSIDDQLDRGRFTPFDLHCASLQADILEARYKQLRKQLSSDKGWNANEALETVHALTNLEVKINT